MSESNGSEEALYSESEHGHVSEDEDVRTALSPTDGYFGTQSPGAAYENVLPRNPDRSESQEGVTSEELVSPRVPNVMVEDPSLRQDPAEAKAQEAAAEASTANAQDAGHSSEPAPETRTPEQESTRHEPSIPTFPVQNSPAQPHQRPRPGVRTSITRPIPFSPYPDAPPPYTPPATTAPYGTLPPSLLSRSPAQDGGQSEQQPLLSDLAQPVTPPLPTPETGTPSWMLPYWAKGQQRVRVKIIYTAIVLLVLFVVMAATFITYKGSAMTEYIEEPVAAPRLPKDEKLRWKSPERCGSSVRGRVDAGHSLSFDPTGSFTLLQTSDENFTNSDLQFAHVFGDVILRPATDIFPSGYVLAESISNTENLGISIHIGIRSGVIKIVANRGTLNPDEAEPCLQIRIILYVPPGAQFGSLEVRTDFLDITVEEGLSMTASDLVSLVSFQGNLNIPVRTQGELSAPYRLAAPYITVGTYKGRISGWLPAYEVLSVGAGSKINISSSLKSLRSGPPRTALVVAASDFDDIQVRQLAVPTPKSSVARDHQVSIKTGAGNITAELLHVSTAELDASNGTINVTLITPPGDGCRSWGHKYCAFVTTTTGGDQRVVVKRPRSGTAEDDDQDTEDISSAAAEATVDLLLRCAHLALGGNIAAYYPGSWEGKLEAVTRRGNLSYTGEGLTTKTDDAAGHRLLGWKGVGDAVISVRTDTGDQRVAIGG